MIACDSYLSLFFFTLQKKLRSGAIVRFSDNSSFNRKRNSVKMNISGFAKIFHEQIDEIL